MRIKQKFIEKMLKIQKEKTIKIREFEKQFNFKK